MCDGCGGLRTGDNLCVRWVWRSDDWRQSMCVMGVEV